MIHGARMFPQCYPVSHAGNIVSSVSFCFQEGNLNENPSMQAPAKILRARASEHSSNFFFFFEQKPNFASTFKLDGTMRYPCTDCLLKLGSNILCDIEDNTWVLVDMEFLFRYLLEISRVSLPSE